MNDRLTEIRRCNGMKMNEGKTKVMRIRTTIPSAGYGRSQPTGKCEIFQLFGQYDNK
jgi:hypothetical protein